MFLYEGGNPLADLIMNMLEKERDRKLTDLYQILTKSDLKGHIESNGIVRNLYAIYCLDAVNGREIALNENDYLILSRQLMRIDETQLFDWDCSLETWAYGLLAYMKDKNLCAADIQKMSSVDLKKAVHERIENRA